MSQDQKKTEKKAAPEAAKRPPKKPYSPPRLIEHGSLADLTQFGGSAGGNDFFGGKRT